MRFGSLLALLVLVGACAGGPADEERSESQTDCCSVTVNATVREGNGTLYVTGNIDQLCPWQPNAVAMEGLGSVREARLQIPAGTEFEYKFTLGGWDREAVDFDGTIPPNHVLSVDGDTEVSHEIVSFKKDPEEYFADWEAAGVLGTLVYWPDFESDILGHDRHVEIWLPPGYDENPDARYPVLYMSDGQNLFDPGIASTGVDWGVDESVVRLVENGVIRPIIVVGAWNTVDRGMDYSPWHGAPDYARFLIEELMPRVNQELRTLTGPENTAVMGSSMGGLLSFYLVTYHPETFGACGWESTHFPLSEAVVAEYFEGADHNEAAWRARIDDPLTFMFGE
jgi:hypothetical protein